MPGLLSIDTPCCPSRVVERGTGPGPEAGHAETRGLINPQAYFLCVHAYFDGFTLSRLGVFIPHETPRIDCSCP